jgi:predicted TPR repeat methyltransferase
MLNPDDFKVSDVYSYENPADLCNYYNDWAHAYDAYCQEVKYALPSVVAKTFANKFTENRRLVLDVGCGTGLVGKYLKAEIKDIDIHGIDISSEMTKIAAGTESYERCSVVNIKERNELQIGFKYDGLISAGTFTLGHLDETDLEALFALLNKKALVVTSIKKDHFINRCFDKHLFNLTLNKKIYDLRFFERNAYDTEFEAKNIIASFRISG